jgi:hypothetical protein
LFLCWPGFGSNMNFCINYIIAEYSRENFTQNAVLVWTDEEQSLLFTNVFQTIFWSCMTDPLDKNTLTFPTLTLTFNQWTNKGKLSLVMFSVILWFTDSDYLFGIFHNYMRFFIW